MKLEVESLLCQPEDTTRIDFSEQVEFPADLGKLLQPLAGPVTVTRAVDSSLLQVQGALETEVELVCDRCMGPVITPIHLEVDEDFAIVTTPDTALEAEEAVAANGFLDLSDLLRQHLILSVPGRKHCGCEPAYLAEHRPIDPRWRALQALAGRRTEEDSAPHGTT